MTTERGKINDFIVVPGQEYLMDEAHFRTFRFSQVFAGSRIIVTLPSGRRASIQSDAPIIKPVIVAGDPYINHHYAFFFNERGPTGEGRSPQEALDDLVRQSPQPPTLSEQWGRK